MAQVKPLVSCLLTSFLLKNSSYGQHLKSDESCNSLQNKRSNISILTLSTEMMIWAKVKARKH